MAKAKAKPKPRAPKNKKNVSVSEPAKKKKGDVTNGAIIVPNFPRSQSKKAEDKKKVSSGLLGRARKFHEVKREVLAPFVAELLIRTFLPELSAELEEEYDSTVYDIQSNASYIVGDSGNEDGDSDANSRGSHESDWRRDKSSEVSDSG